MGDQLPADSIPLSVVRLELPHVTEELVAGLLATRSQRALQRVTVDELTDSKTAALVGELISTDLTSTQWTFKGTIRGEAAAAAFCRAVTVAHSATRTSSLTRLIVSTDSSHAPFAAVLAAVPTITCFQLFETDNKVQVPFALALP